MNRERRAFALRLGAAAAALALRPARAALPTQYGLASWYGPGFHGRRMANGERFDMWSDSAAHRSLPFGTRCRVTCLRTGASAAVVVRDRGPFIRPRILDVSRGTARAIGMEAAGVAPVALAVL